ncbi:MAG: response regulator [Acidobacteria bacterium]|nr:response regulator [Acidobacteriota bacterium]
MKKINVLYLEDNNNDAELVETELLASDIDFDILRVDNREEYIKAIEGKTVDLILSDFSIPSFDGTEALKIAKEKCPEVPFIYVSGTIGEEAAIESFRNGATDYVLKSRFSRLTPVIKRALQEKEENLRRKQAEEYTKQQAMVIDIVPNSIQMLDLDGTILFWSKGSEKIYGWKPSEVVGGNVQNLMFKENIPQFTAASKFTTEKGEWIGELNQITKRGRKIIVESHWLLVKSEYGSKDSVLVVNTDITEKKELESQFLRAQRMECVGALASGIAHDLNNVLAPIVLSLEILKKRLPDEKSRRILSILENSSQRGAELVQQVLSFGRGMGNELQTVQINHVVREIEQIIKEIFPKNITITARLAKNTWQISAIVTQLHQVLMNLCVNARDAMPEGGILTISVENISVDESYTILNADAKIGPYVCISITDTGEGIPKDIADKVFEPFFTTKELGKGTGLGLATVVSIVKGHEGFITLHSDLNLGTEFKIFLPATSIQPTLRSKQDPQELLSGQGELILVIDDEAYIREVTKAALEAYNYQVITASDGAEAIAIYLEKKEKISLVVTDLVMPFMSGAKVIEALRNINPNVKIIVLTGVRTSSMDLTIVKVNAVLAKPYTTEELLKTIQVILGDTRSY